MAIDTSQVRRSFAFSKRWLFDVKLPNGQGLQVPVDEAELGTYRRTRTFGQCKEQVAKTLMSAFGLTHEQAKAAITGDFRQLKDAKHEILRKVKAKPF